jgi:hypothetical protein
MFGYLIEVRYLFYHVNIVFFILFTKLWLQYHEKILSLLTFQSDSLRIRWHFTLSYVNLALDISSPVIKHQHIAALLPSKGFQSSDDGNSVEILALKTSIFF